MQIFFPISFLQDRSYWSVKFNKHLSAIKCSSPISNVIAFSIDELIMNTCHIMIGIGSYVYKW